MNLHVKTLLFGVRKRKLPIAEPVSVSHNAQRCMVTVCSVGTQIATRRAKEKLGADRRGLFKQSRSLVYPKGCVYPNGQPVTGLWEVLYKNEILFTLSNGMEQIEVPQHCCQPIIQTGER